MRYSRIRMGIRARKGQLTGNEFSMGKAFLSEQRKRRGIW